MAIIHRIRKGKSAAPIFDPGLPDTEEFDITTGGKLPKNSFTISKSDYKSILTYVRAIRNGWLKVDKYGKIFRNRNKEKRERNASSSAMTAKPVQNRSILAPPKERLPSHAESYNPPNEYLLTKQQRENFLSNSRFGRIIPRKYDSLRKVPAYGNFLQERFERCLDLYLCPRQVRTRTIIDPKDALPKLPSVHDLKPFPEILSLEFVGHSHTVRCLDISPCGTWLATGSDDGTVRVWEIETGREFWRHSFGTTSRVESVRFNPLIYKPLLMVVVKHRCILIPLSFITNADDYHTHVVNVITQFKKESLSIRNEKNELIIPRLGLEETMKLFKQNLLEELKNLMSSPNHKTLSLKKKNDEDESENEDKNEDEDEKIELNTNDINIAARWCFITFHGHKSNTICETYKLVNHNVVCVNMLNYLTGACWHAKGEYFATWRPQKQTAALIIHRFGKFSSQIPFTKAIGEIQDVLFHPRRPYIYVACKQSIHCFDLSVCKLIGKFLTTLSWINTFDLHKEGLNIISGGMDGRVCWYDIDLSHKPYKTFRFHKKAVRKCIFHPSRKYSHLWATCGDDGTIKIFYCKMFRDVYADPVLIPLKIINVNRNNPNKKRPTNHRVLDIQFHPKQPWIIASCSDSITRLYTAL
ncbi:ribosome biogenesis protein bop1 [Reticulomyxa filosa]|uniref:Ribosome biogenesis protein bop1 n=1 Tax=Reticulomyxa filosa TaxID=46433 RepID=X6LXQ4_RETFI|nr:ribosome biogenesis protein bop1 [Reticulomyxa filosa]|eukprot:ETO05515.1 ribosome biogenesis protein bop1 [Reticulomyxa filosa]